MYAKINLMKRVFLFLVVSLLANSVFATECSDFLKNTYQKNYDKPLKVVSKLELINNYEQEIGNTYVPYIAYGNGYMKVKRCKKTNISYIQELQLQ